MRSLIVSSAVLLFGIVVSSVTQADTLGIDFVGTTDFVTYIPSNQTYGYAFSLPKAATVSGLGFWDADNIYGKTTVGLWDPYPSSQTDPLL